MRDIRLVMNGTDYTAAGRVAKEAALKAGGRGATMIAWYDRARNLVGPQETCAKEGWKCSRDYAEHHGADLRVSINDDAFEFFFSDVASDFAELDREDALDAHIGASRDEFDDVQGG